MVINNFLCPRCFVWIAGLGHGGTDDSYEGGAASLLISGNGSNYDKVTNGRPTVAAKVAWVPGW